MYVKTENGEAIDFTNGKNKSISVKPVDGTSSWQLVATQEEDGLVHSLATFEKASDAEKARESLLEHMNADKAWDAAEFKEILENSGFKPIFAVVNPRRD